jgi:PAS domain S-box-containing protein
MDQAIIRDDGYAIDHRINRRIFETSLDLILVVERQGTLLRVSPSARAILGYDPEDMVGRSGADFIYPGDLDSTREEMRAARRGRVTRHFECRYVHKDGRVVTLSWTGVWSEAEGQHFFIGRDITDVKRLEQELEAVRRRDALVREAIDNIPEGFAIYDESDRLIVFNKGYQRLYPPGTPVAIGVRLEDLMRDGIVRGIYPDALGREEEWLAGRLRHHREALNTVEQQLSDGRWVLVSKRRISNDWIAGLQVDITRQKAAEAALAESQDYLERAQRLAHMGSYFRNLVTDSLKWSDECCRIFGVSPDQFVPTPRKFLEFVHPDDRASVAACEAEVARGVCPAPIEYRVVRPDGTVRHLYRETELIRDAAGRPISLTGMIHDVTERRQTEEQLRQAQKMEAIGNLTGGMAHDFNNLLGVIIGNLDLAREQLLPGDDELSELVEEARQAAWKGADLTRRLLAFARRQPLRPAQIGINELVADTVRLLRRMLGEDIEIMLGLDEGIWPVVADPAQLEASLANLAGNARDAMPNGGRLTINTRNARLDADYAASHADVTPGEYAMIEVSDTGSGIPPETMSRIFEPFFTTKDPGKGTGLGLSMVFGFMKQSNGHINVYSEPGVGTTFRLYLPRAVMAGAPQPAQSTHLLHRGVGERVLVVEDNLSVRRVVVRQLRDLGYRVIETERAAAALEILAAEPVDALLTDIVMPGGLDGVELALLALERWPALKVVLTSGFPEIKNGTMQDFAESLRLLSKPYSKDELAAALRQALDG